MKHIITGCVLLLATAFVTSITAQEIEVREEDGKKECIIKMGTCGSSFLGVHLDEVTGETAQELGLREERGAHLTKIVEDSPAAKAGLQANDVVVGWNGQRVESAAQLQRLVRETPVGRTVELAVMRNGSEMTVNAELGARSVQWNSLKNFHFGDMPNMEGMIELGEMPELAEMPGFGDNHFFSTMIYGGGRLGVTVQTLSPQLGRYFGIQEETGVLVSEVSEQSAAEKAGLQAADIITSVDGKAVTSPHELSMAINSREAGPVKLTIIRDKREQTITAELGKKSKNVYFFNKNEDNDFEFRFESDDHDDVTEDEVMIKDGSDLE